MFKVFVVLKTVKHTQGSGCSCCEPVEFTSTTVDSIWTDKGDANKRAKEVEISFESDGVNWLDIVDVEESEVYGTICTGMGCYPPTNI